jgi:hypothetical protein
MLATHVYACKCPWLSLEIELENRKEMEKGLEIGRK